MENLAEKDAMEGINVEDEVWVHACVDIFAVLLNNMPIFAKSMMQLKTIKYISGIGFNLFIK